MNRRDFIALVGATTAFPRVAFAQQQARVPRVALVSGAIAVDQMYVGKDANWGAVVDQMAIDGFAEGRTVSYDRYLKAAGTDAVLDDNARSVIATAPDAIFWGGATATARVAIGINKSIPMVVESTDLLSEGIVTNIAHPGGNVTGISVSTSPDSEGKKMELVADVLPAAKVVAYTNSAGAPGQILGTRAPYLQAATAAASKLGLTIIPILYAAGGGETEFVKVFATIAAAKAEIIVFGDDTAVTASAQQAIMSRMASAARLPAIAGDSGFANAGGLLSYGPNYPKLARQCADYVAAILKGSKPGDMPVLQPTTFDFVVNLKTAQAIGVTIPQSLLLQATEVIQ